ncbi:MAG: 1,4-dihydroxy-6-naphthoate synthase [Desulfovibrio sp.]|jgi:1,4-dihydroxy-6-naphthoate synthase|nr:1,4-dihydroxy-6-naphthoate synthase [Desulfovibrio sp.]
MTLPSYTLGISPCPNDTYIFEALIRRRIGAPFTVRTHSADVEELNAFAEEGRLDITKISMAAVSAILENYILLNAGGALGCGCGPLLTARPGLAESEYPRARIAVPGYRTTANLLLSLHGGFKGPREAMIFDAVMPALLAGRADLGLIIHEGRFTYAQKGLRLVLDLGEWWEKEKGMPLPLGVIVVRRSLGMDFALTAQAAVRASLAHARAHPEDGREFIRSLAQEMDPEVMAGHIALFVNEYSEDLGGEGREAILALLRAGADEFGSVLPDLPLFAG